MSRIALVGERGSGKSTVARYLAQPPFSYESFAFADAIKDLIAELYEVDRGKLDGLTVEDRVWRKETVLTSHSEAWAGRYSYLLHKLYGVEKSFNLPVPCLGGRSHNQTLLWLMQEVNAAPPMSPEEVMRWIGTHLFQTINPFTWVNLLAQRVEGQPNVLVTDARFQQEVDWLASQGYQFLKLRAKREEGWQRDPDISEQIDSLSLPPHRIIENQLNGIDELYAEVDRCLLTLRLSELKQLITKE